MRHTVGRWIGRALLVVAVAGGATAKERNLLENGGFERGLDGWTFLGNSKRAEAEPDRRTKRQGRQSLRVTKAGGPPFDVLRADVAPLVGGSRVRVSADVRGERAGRAFLKFFVYDAAGESLVEDVDLERLEGTFGWREVSRVFDLPETAVSGAVMLVVVEGGELWIDDVEVVGEPSEERAPEPLDAAARKWLDEHAVRVRTLDFDGSTEDLAPLRELWKDVRIVQLGEPSHGDGAAFAAKARLVRFLHEELGFDVLAFESGLWECERANDLLREGGDVEAAMRGSVFGIWCVDEVRPLFEYLGRRARTERPLRLTGFDLRGSGRLAAGFPGQAAARGGVDLPREDAQALARLDELLGAGEYRPAPEVRAAGRAAFDRLEAALAARREALVERLGEDEAALLLRAAENWRLREEFEFRNQAADAERKEERFATTNLRDGRMAENLRWLADVRYPGRKIVTWAATFHLMHGSDGISRGGRPFYEGCRNMGGLVREAYGDAVYTVGFAAHGGRRGMPWTPKSDVPPPPAGSVEDTLHRYGQPLLFVDLRRPGIFHRQTSLGVLGYARDLEAEWPGVVDGVFFTDVMTPSSRLR